MGTLVTLDLSDGSPLLALPWIITFGPLGDEEDWEPVVCGPYEHAHALALAESVVTDEDLMAVVEPLQTHVSLDQIRGDIAAARLAADVDAVEDDMDESVVDLLDDDDDDYLPANGTEPFDEPSPPPTPDEVRAGMARIATRLTGG